MFLHQSPYHAQCLEAVSEGKADLVNLDGNNMYTGFNSWNLRPIASENNGGGVGFGEYYSVAIVPKAFCDGSSNKTLADLKGKHACMTGYGRSAGWALPMGQMLSRGIIPSVRVVGLVCGRGGCVVHCGILLRALLLKNHNKTTTATKTTTTQAANTSQLSDDAENVADFFSKVCAVADGNGPLVNLNGTRQQSDRLCSACKVGGALCVHVRVLVGKHHLLPLLSYTVAPICMAKTTIRKHPQQSKNTCNNAKTPTFSYTQNTTNGQCSKSDAYWDYAGAFRGVVEGGCDVAFTKSTVLDEYVKGGANAASWAPASASDYRLLCPSGGCATKDQVASCNFGTV